MAYGNYDAELENKAMTYCQGSQEPVLSDSCANGECHTEECKWKLCECECHQAKDVDPLGVLGLYGGDAA